MVHTSKPSQVSMGLHWTKRLIVQQLVTETEMADAPRGHQAKWTQVVVLLPRSLSQWLPATPTRLRLLGQDSVQDGPFG